MLILGLETSGLSGEVALLQDGKVLGERSLTQAGRRHAQTLVSEVQSMLQEFELRPRDCDLVAVSRGPGSFTGLRVGIVFAKTFAYATGCRLAAVDTFEAIAASSPAEVDSVWVVEDAQRGDLFVGRYERTDQDEWRNTVPIQIVSASDWLAARSAEEVLTGPGLKKLPMEVLAGVRRLAPEYWSPRAATVARLGAKQVAAGQVVDPWSLQPFYLRKSAAEEKWDATQRSAPSQ